MAADLTTFPVTTIKVTEMTPDSTPNGADIFMVVDSADGSSKRMTITQLLTLVPAGGIAQGATNPAGPVAGDVFYNTTDNVLRYYNGTAWVDLTAGGASPASASETVEGIIEIATDAEVTAGTDDTRAITPLKLKTLLDADTSLTSGATNPATGTDGDLFYNTTDNALYAFDGTNWVAVDNDPLNNFTAIVDPTVSDDDTQGYEVGSQWINTATGAIFELVDDGTGAAVWTKINSELNDNITDFKGLGFMQIDDFDTSAIKSVKFGDNGNKLYVLRTYLDFFTFADAVELVSYDLTTPYDISTPIAKTINNLTLPGTTVGTFAMGFAFKDDGTQVYVLHRNRDLSSYPLSTAWDISSAGAATTVTTGLGSITNQDLCVSPDGTKFIVSGTSAAVGYLDLSTAWDITTIGAITGASYDFSTLTGYNGKFEFVQMYENGSKMIVFGGDNAEIVGTKLPTGFDVSSMTSWGQKLQLVPYDKHIALTGGTMQYFRFGYSITEDGQYMLAWDGTRNSIVSFKK